MSFLRLKTTLRGGWFGGFLSNSKENWGSLGVNWGLEVAWGGLHAFLRLIGVFGRFLVVFGVKKCEFCTTSGFLPVLGCFKKSRFANFALARFLGSIFVDFWGQKSVILSLIGVWDRFWSIFCD